jgi:hypothetical protein
MTNAAINVDSVLIWGLKAATGVEVYPFKQPEGTPAPFVTYRFVSDLLQDTSQNTGGSIHLGRIQITHVHSSLSGLRSLVDSVRGFLNNNQTDFQASLVDGNQIDDKESDNVFYTVKDYRLQWKSS